MCFTWRLAHWIEGFIFYKKMNPLIKIQTDLKVPKGNYNSFGKYKYRSAEDILEAVKPLLSKHECRLILSDEIQAIGNKLFLKATATISNAENSISVFGYAELSEHKGMSAEQCTGTASSYARKYALNGLFLIDETESDADNNNIQTKPELNANQFEAMIKAINEGKKDQVIKSMDKYTIDSKYKTLLETAIKNN